MARIDPCSPIGRYLDIMKQGFMKPLSKPRKVKTPLPMVACAGCLNWHRKNAHIELDAAVRKVNRERLGYNARTEQH